MQTYILYPVILALLFLAELIYFHIADPVAKHMMQLYKFFIPAQARQTDWQKAPLAPEKGGDPLAGRRADDNCLQANKAGLR